MSLLIADTPLLEAYVRNEFFYDGQKDKKGFTYCYIFGFRAEPIRALTFQIMTEQGAQWARVPIHMLCWKECEALPLDVCLWWDCYGYEFAVHEFNYLRGHTVSTYGRDTKVRKGTYRFTIDWIGGMGEIPNQHKQHHVIALESGQFIAYPNNRLLWHDESWIVGLGDTKPDWEAHSQAYSVEAGLYGPYKRKTLTQ